MRNNLNKKRLDKSYQTKRRKFVNQEKLRRGHCLNCGLQVTLENVVAFDFDHIDRTTKRKKVSLLCASASFDSISDELAKCVLLCAICHRIKTVENGDNLPLDRPLGPVSQLSLFESWK